MNVQTMMPITVFSIEGKYGWPKDKPMRAFLQVIDSGFAVYKADAFKENSAGYKTYPTISSFLEDFEVSEADSNRIDVYIKKEEKI